MSYSVWIVVVVKITSPAVAVFFIEVAYAFRAYYRIYCYWSFIAYSAIV